MQIWNTEKSIYSYFNFLLPIQENFTYTHFLITFYKAHSAINYTLLSNEHKFSFVIFLTYLTKEQLQFLITIINTYSVHFLLEIYILHLCSFARNWTGEVQRDFFSKELKGWYAFVNVRAQRMRFIIIHFYLA